MFLLFYFLERLITSFYYSFNISFYFNFIFNTISDYTNKFLYNWFYFYIDFTTNFYKNIYYIKYTIINFFLLISNWFKNKEKKDFIIPEFNEKTIPKNILITENNSTDNSDYINKYSYKKKYLSEYDFHEALKPKVPRLEDYFVPAFRKETYDYKIVYKWYSYTEDFLKEGERPLGPSGHLSFDHAQIENCVIGVMDNFQGVVCQLVQTVTQCFYFNGKYQCKSEQGEPFYFSSPTVDCELYHLKNHQTLKLYNYDELIKIGDECTKTCGIEPGTVLEYVDREDLGGRGLNFEKCVDTCVENMRDVLVKKYPPLLDRIPDPYRMNDLIIDNLEEINTCGDLIRMQMNNVPVTEEELKQYSHISKLENEELVSNNELENLETSELNIKLQELINAKYGDPFTLNYEEFKEVMHLKVTDSYFYNAYKAFDELNTKLGDRFSNLGLDSGSIYDFNFNLISKQHITANEFIANHPNFNDTLSSISWFNFYPFYYNIANFFKEADLMLLFEKVNFTTIEIMSMYNLIDKPFLFSQSYFHIFYKYIIYYWSEIFLISGVLLLLILGVIYSNILQLKKKYIVITEPIINLSILFITLYLIILYYIDAFVPLYTLMNELLLSGFLLYFFKFVISLFLIFILLFSFDYLKQTKLKTFEIIILFLLSFIGFLTVISSNHFLILYLGIELQSLCFYILAAYKQHSNFSTEAGLKYFILGALSSGFLLFGISLLYGAYPSLLFNEYYNSIDYYGLHSFWSFLIQDFYYNFDWPIMYTEQTNFANKNGGGQYTYMFQGLTRFFYDLSENIGLFSLINFFDFKFTLLEKINQQMFGFLFIIFGFLFKIGAVPFHNWLPDVYEGVSTLVTAFFSTLPKFTLIFVLFLLFIYFFHFFFFDISFYFQNLFILSGLFSLIVGTFGAIGQYKIKRMLAYSSIGHIGFILLAYSTGTIFGFVSIFIYLFIYMFLTFGIFIIILSLRNQNHLILKKITDFSGLLLSQPLIAMFFALYFFSLAGIPPLAGFFSKFFLFIGLISSKYYFIAIFAILLSVIGSYYYIRIIKIMFFKGLTNKNYYLFRLQSVAEIQSWLIVFFSILNILFFLYPEFFIFKLETFIYMFISNIILSDLGIADSLFSDYYFN